MSTILKAGNSTTGGTFTPDSSGALEIKTGAGAGTTAITISSTQVATFSAGALGALTSMTALAYNWNGLTTNTFLDFTGIPAGAKRITVMFNGVSTNGTSLIQVQIGDSGGIETTGYSSGGWTANVTNANSTTGFIIHGGNAAASRVWDGAYTIVLMDTSNTWVFTGMCNSLNDNAQSIGIGRKQVSPGPLDRVRITTVNGTDVFDAGSVNILYE